MRDKPKIKPARQCQNCLFVHKAQDKTCPNCGNGESVDVLTMAKNRLQDFLGRAVDELMNASGGDCVMVWIDNGGVRLRAEISGAEKSIATQFSVTRCMAALEKEFIALPFSVRNAFLFGNPQ